MSSVIHINEKYDADKGKFLVIPNYEKRIKLALEEISDMISKEHLSEPVLRRVGKLQSILIMGSDKGGEND